MGEIESGMPFMGEEDQAECLRPMKHRTMRAGF